MDFKKLAPVVLAFLAVSAKAQQIVTIVPVKLPPTIVNIVPVQMPAKLILPVSLPTIDGVIITPIRSPYTPAYIPVTEPINLPVAPALIVGKAVLPGVPSLPEAIAHVAEKPVKSARNYSAELFDGRRESSRSSALPSEKFF